MKLQEIIRNNYKFAGIAAASFLIDEEMKKGTHYKTIYQVCKANGEQIMRFAYLPRLEKAS